MREINYEMKLLSVLAIVMVVCWHAECDLLNIGGILECNYFVIPMFVFISGYFFSCKQFSGWLKKKIIRLIVPYYLIHFVFCALGYILCKQYGLKNLICKLSWKALWVDPLFPHTLAGFNSAMWFVIILFYIEIVYATFYMINKHMPAYMSYLELFIVIAVALYCIYAGDNKFYETEHGRSMVIMTGLRVGTLFPYFVFGQIYKKKIERYISKRPIVSTVASYLVMIVLFYSFPEIQISYKSLVFTYLFAPIPFAICGIVFWDSVAKVISKGIADSKLVLLMGNNTFEIMSYHLFGFFLINVCILWLQKHFLLFPWADVNDFINNPRSAVFSQGGVKWMYLLGGILVSLSISYLVDRVQMLIIPSIKKTIYRRAEK